MKVSFTLIELLVVIGIIAILTSFIFPAITPFFHHRDLELSALMLSEDISQAQRFSRVRRDGYQYYGLILLNNAGPKKDRDGYKLVCYLNCSPLPSGCDINNPEEVRIIKSWDESDSPEIAENTYFPKGVKFNATTLQIVVVNNRTYWQLGPGSSPARFSFGPAGELIVNNSQTSDYPLWIPLKGRSSSKDIFVNPLTGYVEIE